MSNNRNIYDDYDNPGCLKTFLRVAIVIGCLFWLFRFGFSTFGSPSPLPSPTPRRSVSFTVGSSSYSSSSKRSSPTATPDPRYPYIGNKNTKKFHESSCSSVNQMLESNKDFLRTRQAAIDKGYSPCGRCHP